MDITDTAESERSNNGFPNRFFNNGDGFRGVGWSEKQSNSSSLSSKKASDKMGGVAADSSPKPFLDVGNTSLFSTSLPASFFRKSPSAVNGKPIEGDGDTWDEIQEAEDPFEEMVSWTIGDLLPDDEELLAGIVDGFENLGFQNKDDYEEFDLFSSGGGLELDGGGGGQESYGKLMKSGNLESDSWSSALSSAPSHGLGYPFREHPYGEHPSRTLFVRNINSNVDDSELRTLFEQYGDIRTLYTTCKHRGFVMISYYDIRAARNAMKALQNKSLRQRKLDIHFSIPKDNPSDKDINQGTLVVFNLDASVTNDDLHLIFGAYGEVKEIRETPHKWHHKFIEFYDVRAAEAALRALNRSDIAGKKIKVEPSRPGGARRSLMQLLGQELEREESLGLWSQAASPSTSSPPGHPSLWSPIGSPVDSGFMRRHPQAIGLGTIIHGGNNNNKPLPDLAGTCSPRAGTIGSHLRRGGSIENNTSSGQEKKQVAHSLPEYYTCGRATIPFSNDAAPSSHLFLQGFEGTHLHRAASNGSGNDVLSSQLSSSLFEHTPGGIGIPNSHVGSMDNGSIPDCMFHNTNNYHQLLMQRSSLTGGGAGSWSTMASSQTIGLPITSGGHLQPQPFVGYSRRVPPHMQYHPNITTISNSNSSQHYHVGSAPTTPGDLGHYGESPDTPFLGPGSYGPFNTITGNNATTFLSSSSNGGYMLGGGGTTIRMMSPRRRVHMFQTAGTLFSSPSSLEGLSDRGRLRRTENSAFHMENKKLYELDLERIIKQEDTRTTLMIKNIPNKYTSKMLLIAIDEKHRGMYNFLYLPIDFKNKCNVGYAFINMTSPSHIIPFYEAFNGKKWEKFNSEKVASLAYARIQGKAALVAHFQNSSLMNEDKRCRPILFHCEGPEAGSQEPFPLGSSNRPKMGKDGGGNGDVSETLYVGSMEEDYFTSGVPISRTAEN